MVHGRRTLYDHLAGTAEILAGWAQPRHVCAAGLLHSVYSTDAFEPRLFDRGERDRLRALAGHDAERLVWLFCSVRRRELVEALSNGGADAGREVRLASRIDAATIELTPAEAGNLLVLYVANHAEQACTADGGPDRWLHEMSRVASLGRPLAERVPPVFAGSTAIVSRDDEQHLLDAYRAATSAPLSSRDGVDELLAAAAGAVPWVAEPAIALGLRALARGDRNTAAVSGARAGDTLAAWNTAWDKRLPATSWARLASWLVGDSAERTPALLRATASRPEELYAQLDALGAFTSPASAASPPLPPRFAGYVTGFRDRAADPLMGNYPGLTARPWHDAERFELARELERAAPSIAAELQGLSARAFHAETEPIARSGNWDVFMLFERGRRNEENCARCPVTTRIVESQRTVRAPGGLIYFSRLAPRTRVAPHTGPTNLRLRLHLGLDIPPECGLRVGGESRRWRTGECVVFDDSFEHEVWNDADRERTVLIVDLWHPDLSDDEVALLEGLGRYAFAHARSLERFWAANEAARRGAERSAAVSRAGGRSPRG